MYNDPITDTMYRTLSDDTPQVITYILRYTAVVYRSINPGD